MSHVSVWAGDSGADCDVECKLADAGRQRWRCFSSPCGFNGNCRRSLGHRNWEVAIFYVRKQLLFSLCFLLCFQHVLAIAILSVCPSVCSSVTRVDQSKALQARITKSSSLAAWKILVSGTVKLFLKFEGGHPEQGR